MMRVKDREKERRWEKSDGRQRRRGNREGRNIEKMYAVMPDSVLYTHLFYCHTKVITEAKQTHEQRQTDAF